MIDMRTFDMHLLQLYTNDMNRGKTFNTLDQFHYSLVCLRLNSYYSDPTFYTINYQTTSSSFSK